MERKPIIKYHSECLKELYEEVEKNPLNLNDLRIGSKVKLWTGLEKKSNYFFKMDKERTLKDNLLFFFPLASNYFSKRKKIEEICDIREEKARIRDIGGFQFYYKFLELA